MLNANFEVFKYWRIKGASPESIFWIIFVFILLGIAIAVYFVLQNKKYRKMKKNADENNFNKKMEDVSATANEKELLKNASNKIMPEVTLLQICTNLDLFNKLWDEYIVSADLTESEREDIECTINSLKNKLGLAYKESLRPLQSSKEIPSNTELHLMVKDQNGNNKNNILIPARVHENTSESLNVVFTKGKFQIPIVTATDKISVHFWLKNDANYSFITRLIDVISTNEFIWCLEHSEDLRRTQMREYVRAIFHFPIKIWYFGSTSIERIKNMPSEELIEKYEIHKAEGIDLSGGGLSVKIGIPMRLGDLVKINFNDAKEGIFSPFATVVKLTKLSDRAYKISLKFAEISERERSSIIRIVNRVLLNTKTKND